MLRFAESQLQSPTSSSGSPASLRRFALSIPSRKAASNGMSTTATRWLSNCRRSTPTSRCFSCPSGSSLTWIKSSWCARPSSAVRHDLYYGRTSIRYRIIPLRSLRILNRRLLLLLSMATDCNLFVAAGCCWYYHEVSSIGVLVMLPAMTIRFL